MVLFINHAKIKLFFEKIMDNLPIEPFFERLHLFLTNFIAYLSKICNEIQAICLQNIIGAYKV